jgi:hypothetical protein
MKIALSLAFLIALASPALAGDNGCPNPQTPNRVEDFCCPAGHDAIMRFADGTTACDHMLVPPNDNGGCYSAEHRVESFFPNGAKACRMMNAGEAANYDAIFKQRVQNMVRVLKEACANGDAESCRALNKN